MGYEPVRACLAWRSSPRIWVWISGFPHRSFIYFLVSKSLDRLLGVVDEVVFGAVYQADYAHACPDETELVVEQIPHWGYFYYWERVESDGNRIKHGQWVYWDKFGVKLRQGQFENGKKMGYMVCEGVGRPRKLSDS